MSKIYKKFTKIFSSNIFFWIVLLLFVLESIWMTFSARYPMAFDEAYHFSSIQLYAHHFDPFFIKQPLGPLTYGPLVHNTSFVYHYLLSFPYRVFSHFYHDLYNQIIFLRLINVALFTAGLIIFKKLLIKIKDEPAIANISILVFALLPIVPLLAGEINYDNLGIPLIGLVLLWTIKFVEQLRTKHQFHLILFGLIISISLITANISYLFLPFPFAILLYLSYIIYRFYIINKKIFKNAININLRNSNKLSIFLISLLLIISIGSFSSTYIFNTFKFHNPIPQCNQVLSVERCSTYAPWQRNYIDAHGPNKSSSNPFFFTYNWASEMYGRLLFTINGPNGPDAYSNPPILPILNATFILTILSGFICLIIYGPKLIKKNPYVKMVLFVSFIFLLSLWGRNYHDLYNLGHLVAINGRYLLVILLPFFFIAGLCFKEAFKEQKYLLMPLTLIIILCMLQGGGIISFIRASNQNWYWQNDSFALHLNDTGKNIINNFIYK